LVSAPFTPTLIQAVLREALATARQVGATVALTGGAALEAWGVARATQDIDVVFLLDPARYAALRRALVTRGARVLEERGDPRTIWLRVLLRGVQIDWLRAWDAPTQQALRRAVVRKVLGVRLKVLRAEDLILLKLRVGRPRDLDDATRLYVFQGARLDRGYLKRAVRRLHIAREWSYLIRTIAGSQTSTP